MQWRRSILMTHNEIMITRRAWIGGALAMTGCAPHKGTGFPGFAIVASEGEHTLSAISLERFASHANSDWKLRRRRSWRSPILRRCSACCRPGHAYRDRRGSCRGATACRVGDESLAMRSDPDGTRIDPQPVA